MSSTSMGFVKKFIALAVVTITVMITFIFVGFHLRTESLTENILLQQGRALFSELILVRGWVSQHGGVFVKVKSGVDPNPFLISLPGLKVNLMDEDGSQYTLRNPGLVVQGISELAEKTGQFRFHVASLTPVNPKTSSPDAFERKALESFEKGVEEAFTVEQTENGSFYRYMAPLIYKEECNKCHASQNLAVGDIRGGISISIPMEMVNAKLEANRMFTIISAVVIVGVLFTFLFVLSRKFITELDSAQRQLVEMATTDGLTKLVNRKVAFMRLEEEVAKHIRLGAPLSCLMLDIDHFKSINDLYGHQGGDAVLISMADVLKGCSRKYDVVSRYGGEEFMIILPSTDREAALVVAEKIREKVKENKIAYHNELIGVTVSVGVAELHPAKEESPDSLVKRTDEALYQAKHSGRDNVKG